MRTTNNVSSSSGVGFMGLLQILFIALKLLGVVGWSWFWVMSPAIFSLTIMVCALILLGALVIRSSEKKGGP